MSGLRAGVIGLGTMGRHHARVLQNLDGVELVAVADPVGDVHKAAGLASIGANLEHLLSQRLDICVVATPTATHAEIGLRLAAEGVHALVEKPVAPDASVGATLAEAFERAGLIGCVGHIERYNPSLQSLRDRLTHGDLGEIYQIMTRRQGPFPQRIGDVGVVMDLATHDLDLTAWVSGSRYHVVSAHVAHRSGREHEDLVAIVGSLVDGTVVNHLVNWLSPLKERVTVVTGARGCYVADTMSADLTYFANGVAPVEWDTIATFRGVVEGDMIRYALTKREPLHTELSAFRDAVLGKGSDIVTMRQAVDAVAVAEAALLSAKTGESVSIRDDSSAELVASK